MKMTNEAMRINIEILSHLNETGKLGYTVARNLRKLRDTAKEYLDMREELIRKYGEKDKNGRLNIQKDTEAYDKFLEEMGDIPEIEHDVDIYQISEDVFCSGNITSGYMAELLWMVKNE